MRFRRRWVPAWRLLRTDGERTSAKPNQRLPGSMKLNRPLQSQRQSQLRPPKRKAAATNSNAHPPCILRTL